jgi:hypothetical protein
MAKVNIEDIRIGISALTEEAQVGVLDPKKASVWKHKKNVHNDFLQAVITCWKGKRQTITDPDGVQYEISVKQIPK